MGGQIENRPKSNYKNTKYGESPLLCWLGLHSASSVQRDEPFFKLDREAPFRESPLLPVLGGGVTVASWFVRRVDVEGGYTRLHVSGAGPSQQVILVGSHEPFFKLDREAPFRESPLLPVLGGGVTVASWFVRRVDVEGGYTRLHVSGAGPSQQVVLVGSHKPFFKLDREAPFRESPLLPVLGGGVTVASWFVR